MNELPEGVIVVLSAALELLAVIEEVDRFYASDEEHLRAITDQAHKLRAAVGEHIEVGP